MKTYPPLPRADAADELFEGGHLWIQEKVDGAHLRFQLRASGVLRFGDRDRTYDPDEIPTPYEHAVRHVRRNLDRDALRAAVDDVESVVFFGEATHRRTIDYDWDRLPSFLGFDVWSGTREAFLPPDAVERIFSRLGLRPVNAFEKEVRAVDFDPDSYEIPASAWYDGPPEGVVVRNKAGGRATIEHPEFERDEPTVPADASAEELAREYATRRRFEDAAARLAERGRPITFDAVYEDMLERIVREEGGRVFDDDADVDARAFRSELAALTGEFVEGRS
jgi:hypothetical protein